MNVSFDEFKSALDRFADAHHYGVDCEYAQLLTGKVLLFSFEIADLVFFADFYKVGMYFGVDENGFIFVGFSHLCEDSDDLPF